MQCGEALRLDGESSGQVNFESIWQIREEAGWCISNAVCRERQVAGGDIEHAACGIIVVVEDITGDTDGDNISAGIQF